MVIIISQSRDTVINANKIIAFGVQDTSFITINGLYGDLEHNYSIYVDCGTGGKVIGGFCSKEKAMKTLEEMTQAIQSGIDYSLPKEEDLE